MKSKYVSLVFLSFLLFSCNNNDEMIENHTSDFPNIDNTQAMGVGETLSTPTSTNVKLDSMKMYYYRNFSRYSTNLPGMAYKYETKTTPVNPSLMEVKQSFSYAENGFVDIRTVEVNNHDWYSNKFKFILDYDYSSENQLNNVRVDLYVNDEQVASQNLQYTSETEKQYLNQLQTNEYNIIKAGNIEYTTPKNVFNPERNLLPLNIKLQYAAFFNSEFRNGNYKGLIELLDGYFINNLYINTHVTFVNKAPNQGGIVVPLSNIQYKVRQDHYPEIIQYGNVSSGGYRYLYYYKK
ncbi:MULTISPECIES: hypothetical protein [unclassified Flavobacterium]|uniref:hypothetical protein n=1 Tax=unclassified Flavobacterium TaxID=196869 RepID=UPI0013D8B007|nr:MULTISPECIES: hypothetical protein [unclassified Flavobacterium]MBA5792396.1 hypothetical protein [Flavobacterium sp. xlx-221]